jgi:DNA-binding beta-propeller fold protein YncE
MSSFRPVAVALALTLLAHAPLLAAEDPNNPTGRNGLILVDKRGNYVRFFDPVTLKQLSSFSTGNQAGHEVAISPDHRTAYIPIYGDGVINRNPNPGNVVLMVDLASRQVSGTIDLSPCKAPHGIQVDAKGMLYVVCDISRTLLVVNPTTRRTEATINIEGSGHWLAVLPDASKAYVSHQGGGEFISVVDLKARKMVGRMPTASRGIIASPDGRRVFAMTGGPKGPPVVVAIDTATDRIVDRVGLQGHAQPGYKLKISLDGATLITCGYELGGKVESMVNLLSLSDLHGPQKFFRAGRGTMGFAFGPDGRTVLLANDGDGTVTVADTKRGVVTNTFQAGTGIETLSFY